MTDRIGLSMKRWRNNVLLMIVGTLLGLVFCEIGLRGAGISYPIVYQIDGDLGASLRPGAEGLWKSEGEAYIRVNSAGLRDREHDRVKPAQSLRIAVLGDSFAEAVQVPLENTFWWVLEQEIRACPALGDRESEVINFGVSGYGTAQELITLRHRVWSYSPDIVLLAFVTGNDIRNNSRVLEQDSKRPFFVLEGGQLVPDLRFRDSLGFRLRQTAVLRWTYQGLNSLRIWQVVSEARRLAKARSAQSHPRSIGADTLDVSDKAVGALDATPWNGYSEAGLDAPVYVEPRDPVWKEAWQITEALLVSMRNEVKEKGAQFFVVTLSNAPQVHPDQEVRRTFERHLGATHLFYPDFRIRDLGQRQNFAVLNLAPLFQTYAQDHQVFLHGFENSGIGRGHWNKEGHRLAGQLIAQNLCSALNRTSLPGLQ
ncbi:MAG: SGNH/GDSL hydrolase family protein, partial [Nitrospira sp.]